MIEVQMNLVRHLDDPVVAQGHFISWLHIVVEQAVRTKLLDLFLDRLSVVFRNQSEFDHVFFE